MFYDSSLLDAICPRSMDDRELHALGSRFNVDVLEEASYILWSIWKSSFPPYSSLPACIDALKESAELYSELKASHKRGGYDNIRNWCKCPVVASRRLLSAFSVYGSLPLLAKDHHHKRRRLGFSGLSQTQHGSPHRGRRSSPHVVSSSRRCILPCPPDSLRTWEAKPAATSTRVLCRRTRAPKKS